MEPILFISIVYIYIKGSQGKMFEKFIYFQFNVLIRAVIAFKKNFCQMIYKWFVRTIALIVTMLFIVCKTNENGHIFYPESYFSYTG